MAAIVVKTASKAPGKKNRKYGRGIKKARAYRENHARAKNKIVKIARSSGIKEALEYADNKLLSTWAKKRLAAPIEAKHNFL